MKTKDEQLINRVPMKLIIVSLLFFSLNPAAISLPAFLYTGQIRSWIILGCTIDI
jgi:hypothetical protein